MLNQPFNVALCLDGRPIAEGAMCAERAATRVDYLWIHSSESARDGWMACELHASANGVFTTQGATLLASPTPHLARQASVKGLLRED